MAKDQPAWLALVQKFERTIGEPVEKWVRSDAYFDLVTHASRAYGQWHKAVEEVQREWLHFFNLPTNSDVTALREQLSRVERRLAEVGKEIEDLELDGADSNDGGDLNDGGDPNDGGNVTAAGDVDDGGDVHDSDSDDADGDDGPSQPA